MTFANQPGILITFLSTGAQLEKVVLLQTEQAIPINVYDVKYVRQRLPVAGGATRPYKFLVIGEMGNIAHISILTWALERGRFRPCRSC